MRVSSAARYSSTQRATVAVGVKCMATGQPRAPTRATVAGRLATMWSGGWGRWNVRGRSESSGKRQNLPSCEALSWVQTLSRISMASSVIAVASSKARSSFANSPGRTPLPTPKSKRPRARLSSMVASAARRSGWWKGRTLT